MLTFKEQAAAFNAGAWKTAFGQNSQLFGIDVSEMNPDIDFGRPGSAKCLEVWMAAGIATPNITDDDLKAMIRVVGFTSKSLYANPQTRAVFFSKMRKLMSSRWAKGTPVYEYSYKHLNITKTETRTIRSAYGHKVMAANSAVMVIKYDEVTRCVDMGMAADAEWPQQCIAAELCCGARISEILIESTFTLNSESKETITQTGIAKSKTINKTIMKPVFLITPARLIELIASIRTKIAPLIERYKTKLPTITTSGLITHLSQPVNTRIGTLISIYDHLGNKHPTVVTSHDLRRIYCSIVWQIIGIKMVPMITQNAFLSSLMGHDSSDIGTASSYTTLHVKLPEIPPILPFEGPDEHA